ncbi:MAG: recombinase zinc beta ribbon domain-containing protein, partial [Clostridia bacterium]|nr:recombinase zinc beta ribbon domain-containing protein [Clostridia bacterium]
ADPLVSQDVFDKVQSRLNQRAQAPAVAKARIPYLLQGKAFCGLCGAPMFGESGKSHTGAVYSYYCCYNRKRKKECKKRNERRADLETYIVAQTMEYVLTPSRMKRIASAVVQEYNKEFSASRVDDLEKALSKIERELEKLVDALIDAPKAAHAKIYARMEQLEAQKAEFETDAAKLRVAMNLRLSEKEVIAWLSAFRDGDPTEQDFRVRLIDTFINSVYIYDDRIIVFYNIRGGKQVTHRALQETLESNTIIKEESLAPGIAPAEKPLENKENSKPEKGSDLELPGGEGGIRTHVPLQAN